MAEEKIVIDVSAALADISKLRGGLVDVQNEATKAGKALTSAMNTGAAQGVADAIDDLQKEYDDLKKSADTLKNALKGATEPAVVKLYARSIAELELGMKKLENTGKAAGVALKETNKAAGTGKQVFNELFGALSKVTVILAVISAVKDLVTYSVRLSQQINQAKRSFEAFTGSAEEADKIVNNLIATGQKNFIPTEDILQAGKALLSFGENADELPDVLTRIANVSAATGKNFNELALIYGKARTSGVLYAEDINQLVDAGIPIIQEFAKQMGVSESEIKKLASEGKISFEELQLAMFNLTKEGGKFADQTQVQADSIEGAWKKAVATVQPGLESLGAVVGDVIQGVLEGFVIVQEAIAGLFSDQPKIEVDYSGRDAYEQAKDDLYEQERLEKAAAEARNKTRKKAGAEAAKIERERQQAILSGMKEGVEKEIAQENFRFAELKRQLKRFKLDTTEAEEQHILNIDRIRQKEVERQRGVLEKLLDLRRAINEADIAETEKVAKAREDSLSAQTDALTASRDLKNQEIEIAEEAGKGLVLALEANGASKEEVRKAENALDLEFQKARLQNELEFQLALLTTIEAGDTERIDSVLATIDLLKAKIGNIDTEIKKGGEKSKGILDGLGLTPDDLQNFKTAAKEVIGVIGDIVNAQVQAAEDREQAAGDAVRAAEDALAKEQELQEQGFASNVDLRKRELAEAKAQEDKAIEQRRAAQRRQILLDSALQISGLITSSANIIKGFSAIPIVGLPLGIAAVAAMFGAFIAAKSKALQATKFKHGGEGRVDQNGIIVGASHDGGGVAIEAEGGEMFASDGKRFGIVNKRMTDKHFDLLAAVNKDDKGGMTRALAAITDQPINRGGILGAVGEGSGSSIAIVGGMDKDTKEMLKEWRKDGKRKATHTIEGGYVVTRSGNHTKRVKAR